MKRYTLRPTAADRRRAQTMESKDYFEQNAFSAQLLQRFFAVVPTIHMDYSFDIDPEAPPTSSSNYTVRAILATVSPYVSPTVYGQLVSCWNDYHMHGSSNIRLGDIANLINKEAREALAYSYNG